LRLATVSREYDFPRIGSATRQVDIGVLVFADARSAAKWVQEAGSPQARECIRRAEETFFEQSAGQPVQSRAVAGLPHWLGTERAASFGGYRIELRVGNYPLTVTKVEFQDRAQPNIAYDLAVIDETGVPRALAKNLIHRLAG
jgi:hypothetical protein